MGNTSNSDGDRERGILKDERQQHRTVFTQSPDAPCTAPAVARQDMRGDLVEQACNVGAPPREKSPGRDH